MTACNRALVVVDPQNMFMPLAGSALPVPGANEDMTRLAELIRRIGQYLSSVVVTLDTHPLDHISHAIRWRNREGFCPAPFTTITAADYVEGNWHAAQADDVWWQGEYLKRLEATGRCHTIWPPHGREGHFEYKVFQPLRHALRALEHNTFVRVQYVKKGMHRDTEQFGVFGANVPYPDALETEINQALINQINKHAEVVFVGEASSHCVMDSVKQLLAHIPQSDWKKVVVLRDCMSPVPQPPGGPDFPAMAEVWFLNLQANGVRVMNAAAYEATIL